MTCSCSPEVSLSKILNPTLLVSEGPAMSWRLVQGVPAATPWKGISGYGQWHDMTCNSNAHRLSYLLIINAAIVQSILFFPSCPSLVAGWFQSFGPSDQILHSSNTREMTQKATSQDQMTVLRKLVVSLATSMRKNNRSYTRSACHPVWPTDSSSQFCPKNTVCPRQKNVSQKAFVSVTIMLL